MSGPAGGTLAGMPESAEEIYARVVAMVGEQGRLPLPPVGEWDAFPWEVVDGALAPKVLQPPLTAEPPRLGEADRPCPSCTSSARLSVIWENERWRVARFAEPGGLPLVLILESQDHRDFPDLDDRLAEEFGRLSVRLCRIMSHLPHIGRVHVNRYGDGSAHCHVWFVARPARLPGVLGSPVVEWNEMLPPPAADVWHSDLATVARKLALHGGTARV